MHRREQGWNVCGGGGGGGGCAHRGPGGGGQQWVVAAPRRPAAVHRAYRGGLESTNASGVRG